MMARAGLNEGAIAAPAAVEDAALLQSRFAGAVAELVEASDAAYWRDYRDGAELIADCAGAARLRLEGGEDA
jgi:hypothetical protein